jgi:AraC-like DNA-binding protein
MRDTGFPFLVQEHRLSPDYQFLHYHAEMEITLIVRGRGTFLINGVEHPVRPGNIFLLNSSDLHRARRRGASPCDLLVIYFRHSALAPARAGRFAGEGEFLENRLTGISPLLRDLRAKMQEAAREYHAQPILWQEGCAALLSHLLTLLQRHWHQRRPDRAHRAGRTHFLRLQPVLEHIQTHLGETIYLRDLARVAHLSPSRLKDLFRESFGLSVSHHIRYARVAWAKTLLRESPASISEISQQTGFASFSHFNRTFKSLARTTPSEFRRQPR